MIIGHKVVGRGPERVIVLHGWLGDHTVFSPMFPFLNTQAFTYAFVDCRGYGESRNRSGEHSAAEIAADATALADHLGWRQFHLIGHSMGGMPVQRIIVDATDRVKSACVIAAVPACGLQLPPEGKQMFRAASGSAQHKRGIIDYSTGNRLSATWLDRMVQACDATVTEPAFADYFRMFDETNFADEVKGNTTPLLVVIGEHDPAVNEDVMRATYLAWYPNAQFEIIRNSGHYPMQETPVHLATTVERFMSSHA
jgi:pimeloyl-ACP methyl ester carboxylesterase